MSLELSPGMFRHLLLQAKIAKNLRRHVAESFAFGGKGWRLLDLVGEEKIPAPPTRDPVLLALRRLAWPEPRELSAMNRWAAEQAPSRPHGFLRLALEEIAALEPPAAADEIAFKSLFDLVRAASDASPHGELADLRACCLLQVTCRHLERGDSCYLTFLLVATRLASEGSGAAELQAFLLETAARAAERQGRIVEAISLRLSAVDALCADEELVLSVADRLAEAATDTAELMRRHQPDSPDASFLCEQAARLLDQLSPELNMPLRRRLQVMQAQKSSKSCKPQNAAGLGYTTEFPSTVSVTRTS